MKRAWLLLLLAAAETAAGQGLREAEGIVVVAKGHPLLLQAAKGAVLVSPVRGAELSGVDSLRDLAPGDRVRYSWRSERSGVRLAERIAADPAIPVEGDLAVPTAHLEQELAAGRVTVVDARASLRWEEGHLPGAISIPADGPDASLQRVPPPPAPLVVYGASARTAEAHRLARRFLGLGRAEVRILVGGVRAWESEGRSVEVEPVAAKRLLAAGREVLFVDVRPREVSEAEPLKGALALPLEDFLPGELGWPSQLPPLVLVGAEDSDGRAATALDRLGRIRRTSDLPQWHVTVLKGGAVAWRKAGLSPTLRAARGPLRWDAPPGAGQVGLDEFRAIWAGGRADVVLLNVGSSRAGAPPGALQIPLEALAERLSEVPRDREVVVYCNAGFRSEVAAELLRRNGFRARHLWAVPSP